MDDNSQGRESLLPPAESMREPCADELSDSENAALADEIGFEPNGLGRFLSDAISDPRQWNDPAQELETMAKVTKGLLSLWRRASAEREEALVWASHRFSELTRVRSELEALSNQGTEQDWERSPSELGNP